MVNTTLHTVVLAFLTRGHPISATVPSPYRPRPYETQLPQRDSPFLRKLKNA